MWIARLAFWHPTTPRLSRDLPETRDGKLFSKSCHLAATVEKMKRHHFPLWTRRRKIVGYHHSHQVRLHTWAPTSRTSPIHSRPLRHCNNKQWPLIIVHLTYQTRVEGFNRVANLHGCRLHFGHVRYGRHVTHPLCNWNQTFEHLIPI